MKYGFIEKQASQHGVVRLCLALSVSRAGYYSWLSRTDSRKDGQDRQLLLRIRASFHESRHRYGSPRVHAELSGARGLPVARNPGGPRLDGARGPLWQGTFRKPPVFQGATNFSSQVHALTAGGATPTEA